MVALVENSKIAGMTVVSTQHSASPANQNLVYKPLTSYKLNTLRTKVVGLKVLFIDEISMCGSNLFSFIDFRLSANKHGIAPFGDAHLICLGDLFQLHQVMDRWLFQYS